MYGYYGRNSQDLECCKCFENVRCIEIAREIICTVTSILSNSISKLSEFEYRE